MHFVRTEDLKTGMRLARPVYNKKSILLFDMKFPFVITGNRKYS